MVNSVEWKQLEGFFCCFLVFFLLLFKCYCLCCISLAWKISWICCGKQAGADRTLLIQANAGTTNSTCCHFFSPTVFFKLLSIHTVSCSPQCKMTELQFDLKLYHMCKRCWTILRECHYSSGCSKDNHVCVCDGSKVLRIHELRFFFTGSRHWGVAPHILHTLLDGKVQGLGF